MGKWMEPEPGMDFDDEGNWIVWLRLKKNMLNMANKC